MMTLRKLTIYLMLLSGVVISFASCDDDNGDPIQTTVNVSLNNPEGISSSTLSDINISLINNNTGTKVDFAGLSGNTLSLKITKGSYNIALEGKIAYTTSEGSFNESIRAYKEGLNIVEESLNISLDLFIYNADKIDFVIKEIFYTGNLTPEGKQTADQYFIIQNNSNETQYADGLVLAYSEFSTTTKNDYSPNIMDTDFTVNSMIMVPGTGSEYPIEPGGSFLIANNAVNYKELNENGFDLTTADFEIIYTLTSMAETDNPAVPNMTTILNNFMIHNRGFFSYALGRLEVDVDTYLADYQYECEWTWMYEDWVFDEAEVFYRLPNSWIMDAVNLSVESEFQWIVTSPSLDMGWTYCGKVDKDPTRYGKSVLRRVWGTTADGREILLDTNNSKFDFTPEATPSLKD